MKKLLKNKDKMFLYLPKRITKHMKNKSRGYQNRQSAITSDAIIGFGILQLRMDFVQRTTTLKMSLSSGHIRELEEDGILERIIYAEIPPRVEYKIKTYGLSLMPVKAVIHDWGSKYLKNR
jgi:hypothetical protein